MQAAPLQPFGDGLWIADGPCVSVLGFDYPTRMAVIALPGGGLLLWSPIACTPALRAEIDALGPVRHILSPNHLHHLFLAEWFEAYPDAARHAPKGLREKRRDLDFTHDLGTAPYPDWHGVLDQQPIRGNRITTEWVFHHRPSRTTLFCDLLQQFPDSAFTGWRRIVARLDKMIGAEPSVPRKFRLAFVDRAAARADIAQTLAWPTERVLMAHGTPVTAKGQALLHRAFGWLKA